MKKKELLGLKVLKATSKMMRMAERDQPVRKAEDYWGGKHFYVTYQHGLYMRCAVVGGLLKVAFFLTEHMRAGGRMLLFRILFTSKFTVLPSNSIKPRYQIN